MKRNSEYRQLALKALEGNWGSAALVTFVSIVISGFLGGAFQYGGDIFSPGSGSGTSLIGTLIYLPIGYATMVIFLQLFRGEKIAVEQLFKYYNGRVFLTELLQLVYFILWSCLFIIPGIVKFYSYAMTEFLMLDNPELSYNAAIEKSMQIMKGHKWELFLLDLSFIGWFLLCILTCGLGIILLSPYNHTARAAFYEDLKAEAVNS